MLEAPPQAIETPASPDRLTRCLAGCGLPTRGIDLQPHIGIGMMVHPGGGGLGGKSEGTARTRLQAVRSSIGSLNGGSLVAPCNGRTRQRRQVGCPTRKTFANV